MSSDLNAYWKNVTHDDEHAMEKLYKMVFPSLVHYAYALTGRSEMAEEIVQDIMLKLWQNRKIIGITCNIRSYLFKAVHNQALNVLRHERTLKQSVHQTCTDELWHFIAEHYDLDGPLEGHLFAEETGRIIEKIVESLPSQCRNIFRMSRYELMKNEEISRLLGLSENTVKTQIYKALQKISDRMKNSD